MDGSARSTNGPGRCNPPAGPLCLSRGRVSLKLKESNGGQQVRAGGGRQSPLRCQGIFKHGQCPYKQIEGSKFCPMHGGAVQVNATNRENKRMYQLAKWRDQHDAFVDSDQVKSLREEIGILRIVMQETLNMCQTSADILMYSSKLSDLAVKLEKLVSSCHRLEASTGILLDKTAALHLASIIVRIIGEHVTDENVIDKISEEIVHAIATTNTNKPL